MELRVNAFNWHSMYLIDVFHFFFFLKTVKCSLLCFTVTFRTSQNSMGLGGKKESKRQRSQNTCKNLQLQKSNSSSLI